MNWRIKYKKPPSKKKELIPKNRYFLSWRKNKKLVIRVVKKGKDEIIHFGHKDYKDYTEHKDKERRRLYLLRAKGIKDKKGNLTKDNIFSANYHSIRVLW